MKRQLGAAAVIMTMLCTPVLAQSFNITSLGQNGALTWTNTFTNGLYSVQWASALSTNTQWQDNWDNLKTIVGQSNTVSANVPMFFRVQCVTNLFIPMPVGRTWTYGGDTESFASFPSVLHLATITNAYGLPTLPNNDYTMETMTFGLTFMDGASTGIYPQSTVLGLCPIILAPGYTTMGFRRSTANARYAMQNYDTEIMLETNGPVGTTWGWTDLYGNTNTAQIIGTNAWVNTYAGTFTNCLCIFNLWNNGGYGWPPYPGIVTNLFSEYFSFFPEPKQQLSELNYYQYWVEYVVPGLGPVAWIENRQQINQKPYFLELYSVTDQ